MLDKSYNQQNVAPGTYSSLSNFLRSDGLHTHTCGLSLWQRKNGNLPDSKPRKDQRQDQGRTADAEVVSHTSRSLFVTELCVCRTGTLLCTRQLSRATPTSSTFCSSRVPPPTSSLRSVHPRTLSLNDLMSSDDACVAAQNGNTALSIACRLGYISVVDTLRPATDENLTAVVRHRRCSCVISVPGLTD